MGKKHKQAAAAIMTSMLAVSSVPPLAWAEGEEASAEKTFDFGTGESPVQEGAIQITEQSLYSESAGFGFAEADSVSSADRSGDNPLTSDFVRPGTSRFQVDLPNGDYSVTVTSGDAVEQTETGIIAESIQKVQNTVAAAGEYTERTFEVALVDGQLTLQWTGAVPVINSLSIQKLPERTAGEEPTVYIAGDSTVQTYDEYWRPEAGWGQMIPRYFNDDLSFSNQAIGGRSSKTFITEGRLDAILRAIRPNDYFLIQFGHNDATISRPERYASVPDYKEYLKTYINGARQRGAEPILVTPVGRRDFQEATGQFNISFPEYVQGMKEVAEELNVQLVDLSARSVEYFNEIGPEGTLAVFLHTDPGVYPAFPNGSQDNTHFQEYGAIQMARLVADEIEESESSLKSYVTSVEPPAAVPSVPQSVKAGNISNAGALLTWDESENTDIYKVYRKESTADSFSLIGTSTLPRLTISGMEEGKSYNLYVTAVNAKGESAPSQTITVQTKQAAFKYDFGLAGTPVAAGYNEVNLSTVYSKEKGYGIIDPAGMIGRDRGAGGDDVVRDWLGYFNNKWEFAADVPNGLYSAKVYVGDLLGSARTDVAVEGQSYGTVSAPKQSYTTKIISDISVNDGQMNFAFSGQTGIVNGIELTPILTAPSQLEASSISLDPAAPSVSLKWAEAGGAKEYNIYRTMAGTDQKEKIGTVQATEFVDQTANVGYAYTYSVTTVDDSGQETAPSYPIEVSLIDPDAPAPMKPAGLNVTDIQKDNLTFTWDPVEGAVSYAVYRSEAADGEFSLAGVVKTASFTDKTVLTTIPYYYKVAAVGAGGASLESDVLQTEAATVLKRQAESLKRSPAAVKTDKGVFVSWRILGTDKKDIKFHVFRNGKKVNKQPISGASNLLDPKGKAGDSYEIRPIVPGKEKGYETTVAIEKNYMDIPLDKPEPGVTPLGDPYEYRANDTTIGDVDGDGEYEYIVKWDPSNSKDNSQAGYTGNVYIDAYKLDGTKLWRIDLGKNIRAGAHYTQMIVYDFDGDGKAEIAMKTADGTIDGQGNVIGRADADHRNSSGYILQGDEFLTVFEGATGKALTTIPYTPSRGDVASWGDAYGNRVDRFLAGVAYLDGETPSLIMARGYYTRTVVSAYQFKNGELTKQWTFDSNDGKQDYAGQGYHSLSTADVDGDAKDEIVYGQMVIDDNGKGLYTTGLGHGDALHVSDFVPSNPGLEVFATQENKTGPYGYDMRDAKTGKILWGVETGQDTGRGVAADIDPRHPGAEAWAVSGAWNSRAGGLHTAEGEKISDSIPSANFAIWWDGDLLRELADHTYNDSIAAGVGTIDKWDYKQNKLVNLLTAEGTFSNNTTKGNPAIQADLFGDWREEIAWRTEDSSALRIYTTTDVTEHKLYTLMHDLQYRQAIAWQNVGYNQPPHPSFFLGEGMDAQPEARIKTK
ncbi:rhamnogalacturonan lyase family protein [Domibacillus indicus]|uniref:rhamnogalacturonan lyase family protein n=1 Tax=Domibacillus indicus TaxID=1437523 RepID=UPI0006180545|nr:SGNH/GDSL hydrolase family protein [Domibacillus indicus]